MGWLQIHSKTRQWNWRCHKRSCAARIATLGTHILQQTNGTHTCSQPCMQPLKKRHEEIIKKLKGEFTGGVRTLVKL